MVEVYPDPAVVIWICDIVPTPLILHVAIAVTPDVGEDIDIEGVVLNPRPPSITIISDIVPAIETIEVAIHADFGFCEIIVMFWLPLPRISGI